MNPTVSATIDYAITDDLPVLILNHFPAREGHNDEFWSLGFDGIHVHFSTVEQLQAFDVSCHSAIEDALFKHAHGSHLSAAIAEVEADELQEGKV